MCFSMEASFAAAAILAVGGAVAVASAPRRLIPLAITPFLFAAQQAAEGVVWVGAQQGALGGLLSQAAIAIFLFFAVFFWPLWIPFVFTFAETHPARKQVLGVLGLLGLMLGFLNLITVAPESVAAQVVQCSIQYSGQISSLTPFLYPVCTIIPFLVSSVQGARWLGVAVALTAVVAGYFYWVTFASVWCFFAALVTLGVLGLVRRPENS